MMRDEDLGDHDHSSVTEWIGGLKRGSTDAASKIWARYVEQLVREADHRLKSIPRRAVAEEDIAQEAFAAFFRGVELQRFSDLEDRHDLWQVLIMLADRRAKDYMRRHLGPKQGGGQVHGDSILRAPGQPSASSAAGFDDLAAPPVTPESAEALIRLIQSSFPELRDELLQKIALDRAANYTVSEIAARHGIGLRSAERKIELICRILQESAHDEE
jgi:DNA-directed RNA polymerase specialized sigma24 family protein